MVEKSKHKGTEKSVGEVSGLSSLRAVRDGTYRLAYVNAHRMRFRVNEAAITFSTITDEPTEPGVAEQVLQEQATLIMQYQHVKLLQKELTALIEEYEKVNGEIAVGASNKDAGERVRQIAKGVFSRAAKDLPASPKTN